MKKNWKRLLCIVLCCMTVTGSVYYTYKSAETVEAVVIVDDVAILLMLFAACGIGYTGYVIADQPLDAWVDERQQELPGLEDEIGAILENPDFKVVFDNFYQETGTPNPDEDPDQDPDNKPSRWQQFKDWIKKNYDTTTGIPLAGVAAPILIQLRAKLAELSKNGDLFGADEQNVFDKTAKTIPDDLSSKLRSTYPYRVLFVHRSTGRVSCFATKKPFGVTELSDGNIYMYTRGYADGNTYNHVYTGWGPGTSIKLDGNYFSVKDYAYATNLPVFDTKVAAQSYVNNNESANMPIVSPSPFNPETTALSSKLLEAPDTHEIPNQVYMPTEAQLQDYLNELQNAQSTADRQSAVDNLISAITTPVTDPGTDPGNPDNPDVTPTPAPEEPELKPGQLEFDLKKLFPFCIPFDLIDFVRVLEADPVAPRFTMGFPYLTKDGVKTHEIVLEFSEWDSVFSIMRKVELFLFCIGLILLTRNIIKG